MRSGPFNACTLWIQQIGEASDVGCGHDVGMRRWYLPTVGFHEFDAIEEIIEFNHHCDQRVRFGGRRKLGAGCINRA